MQYRALTRPVRDTLKRYRVVRRLSAKFDLTLGPLALITVVLLIVELLVRLPSPWDAIAYGAQLGIWAIFLLAFIVELSLAPRKLQYLRRNWLLIVALVVPAFRILRIARAARFLRITRLVRGFTSFNRAMFAIRSFLGFSQTAFMAGLTGLVWLSGAALVFYLESGNDSSIDSPGEALWWAATVLTTVAISADPVTTEARIVAITLRIFGVAVIGYFTARLAAFFLGTRDAERSDQDAQAIRALHQEIVALRSDLTLAERRTGE